MSDITMRELLLSEEYERYIETLSKRIEELEALRESRDYEGAIAKRYAFHVLNLPVEELTYDEHRDRLVKLFSGAISEAIGHDSC